MLDTEHDFNLYYFGARYYNAEWGRFISPDPVREFYNLYSYCWDNPINMVDFYGKNPSSLWKAFLKWLKKMYKMIDYVNESMKNLDRAKAANADIDDKTSDLCTSYGDILAHQQSKSAMGDSIWSIMGSQAEASGGVIRMSAGGGF